VGRKNGAAGVHLRVQHVVRRWPTQGGPR